MKRSFLPKKTKIDTKKVVFVAEQMWAFGALSSGSWVPTPAYTALTLARGHECRIVGKRDLSRCARATANVDPSVFHADPRGCPSLVPPSLPSPYLVSVCPLCVSLFISLAFSLFSLVSLFLLTPFLCVGLGLPPYSRAPLQSQPGGALWIARRGPRSQF